MKFFLGASLPQREPTTPPPYSYPNPLIHCCLPFPTSTGMFSSGSSVMANAKRGAWEIEEV